MLWLISSLHQLGIAPKLLLLLLIFLVSVPLIILPMLTLFLAFVTTLRYHLSSSKKSWSDYNSSIYTGRVSHSRFLPVTHSFSYPLFFMFLDLNEVDALFQKTKAMLWPLNKIMQFRSSDHLKNGEGLMEKNGDKPSKDVDNKSLTARIQRLITERTQGKYTPTSNQKIMLLTHLSYFGYCFNPVSFYYILKDPNDNDKTTTSDKTEEKQGETEIDAIVAEVSNTPWEEMSCYVLHPYSVDMDVVKPGRTKKKNKDNNEEEWKSVNYVFQKKFHVSPFMEMDHIYDWTFWDPTITKDTSKISVSTSMMKQSTNDLYFNASFEIKRKNSKSSSSLQPATLAMQLIKYPVYCIIIQLWIHIEAFWLFLKGVPFIPHPQGSETTASRIIANLMIPFFAVQEWLDGGKGGENETGEGGNKKQQKQKMGGKED